MSVGNGVNACGDEVMPVTNKMFYVVMSVMRIFSNEEMHEIMHVSTVS